ncbi:MAG TPA: hypothetical protein VK859_05745 [bacterium]|nr:hypothetical protein [bacterium]
MKKLILSSLFLVLLLTSSMIAKPAPDYYISNYESMDLDFLRSHYTEIDNGRLIQITGHFSSYKWLSPYAYKERLSAIGDDIKDYNILQFTIEENDDFHYSFPILMIHASVGDLHELDQLQKGTKIVIYGKFYNLKKSDYAIETDLIEMDNVMTRFNIQGTPSFENGGHDRELLLDARVSPTATVTPTITPTPPPSLWQKISNVVNPKETITPTGTVTPGT